MTRVHPTTESGVDVQDSTPKLKKDKGLQEVTFSPPVYDDEDEDAPKQMYDPSIFEKIINYMLCRTDLATQKLANKPVSLAELFRFANKTDWLIVLIGTLCAICAGISQPILALVAGRIANVLLIYPPRSTTFRDKAYENVYIFIGIGVFCMFVNFFQYFCFQTVCNRIIARIKCNYVASIIRQNAGWFDKHHSGALTTTLNDNVDRIREGIGEKLGLLLRGFAMLVAAIIVSFIYQWRLSFLMLGVTPASCIVMSFLSQKMGSTTMKELADVGKAGAIAEESVLGVRTVQSCNGQEEMVERYSTELAKGKKFGIQKGYWSGFLGGLFFFVLLLFLGVGILYGAWLLKVGIFTNPGDVFICIMSMLLGAYFLGLVSPHLMVLLNARVAAATIYQTIDRVPKIDVYSNEGERPPNPIGRVVFKDVHFRYPSRKNAKILNGLNLIVEPGQTVALVGHSVDEIDLGDPRRETRIATYDFPPEVEPIRTHRFDDISRKSSVSSAHFGRQAFVRGTSINDSMSRGSGSIAGIGAAGVDAYGRTPDEIQKFMADVAETMNEDDKDKYSILTVYRNAKGEYLNIILGIISSMIAGVQLPALSLAFTYVFNAFQFVQTDPGKMMNTCVRAMGIFLGIGAGSWLAIFLASVFFGYASENLTMRFRVAAFRNILYQDAGYFDNPAHTAGKLITRLASDAPNVKAVVDSRLLQVIQGATAVLVSIIIAFVYSWQIALLGILYLSYLTFTTIFLAYKVMATNMIAEMRKCIYEAINNSVTQTNQFFMCAVCYALGIAIIYKGQKSASDVFQAIVAMLLAAVAVMNSSSYFPEFVKANSSARLLFSMIFRKPKTGDSSVGEKAEIRGNILFEKVKFTYPQKPNLPVMNFVLGSFENPNGLGRTRTQTLCRYN
ncbi:hypothetical protein FO519_008077 [Halicephalobus sp. NKZ332]|nr:hypothetical protein FO519_008077 [Halicephalobus sp. NKZ332]